MQSKNNTGTNAIVCKELAILKILVDVANPKALKHDQFDEASEKPINLKEDP
jgi:hypothetical protein